MTDIRPSWADLQPLTEAEVRRWVAVRDGAPDPVTRWRYLNDPLYHARVEMWERSRDVTGPAFWPEHAHELNPPPQSESALDMLCRGGDHYGCVGPPGTTCECPCHALAARARQAITPREDT